MYISIKICQDLLRYCLLLTNMWIMNMYLLQGNSAERFNILFNNLFQDLCTATSYRVEGKSLVSVTLDCNVALKRSGWGTEVKCHRGFQEFSSGIDLLKNPEILCKNDLEVGESMLVSIESAGEQGRMINEVRMHLNQGYTRSPKKFAKSKLILTSGSGIILGCVTINALVQFSCALLQSISVTSA